MTGYRLRVVILIISTVVCLGFAGAVGYSLLFRPDVYEVPIGGPFELMDSQGKTVTEASFEGRYMLIYFGYTYCPDVCPTRLLEMANALEALEEVSPDRAATVVAVFISLDPERDTPEVMADYVSHFHPAMVGLTGEPIRMWTLSCHMPGTDEPVSCRFRLRERRVATLGAPMRTVRQLTWALPVLLIVAIGAAYQSLFIHYGINRLDDSFGRFITLCEFPCHLGDEPIGRVAMLS